MIKDSAPQVTKEFKLSLLGRELLTIKDSYMLSSFSRDCSKMILAAAELALSSKMLMPIVMRKLGRTKKLMWSVD